MLRILFVCALAHFCLAEENFNELYTTKLTCTTNEDCADIDGAICSPEKNCKCPEGTVLFSDLTKCGPISDQYGSKCSDSSQCSARMSAGGACLEGTCQCGKGYHYQKGYCWKNQALHERCTVDETCIASYVYVGVECNDQQQCECKTGYYEMCKTCRRLVNATESCSLDSDCNPCPDSTLATCTSQKCECSNTITESDSDLDTGEDTDFVSWDSPTVKSLLCEPGTYPNKDSCDKELGTSCSSNEECHIKLSTCLDGFCSCTPNTYVADPSNRKCNKVSKVVDQIETASCTVQASCSVFGAFALCDDSKQCSCNGTSHWVKEDKVCWPTVHLGGDCESAKDCFAAGGPTECSGTEKAKCRCVDGYHLVSGDTDCRQDGLKVGDKCQENEDCLFAKSMCDKKNLICGCQDHYFGDTNVCTVGVEGPCTQSTDCPRNSTCEQDTCTCLNQTVSSTNGDKCLPVVGYDEECVESVQCGPSLDRKECKDGRCQCESKFHYANERCYITKYLGEKCTKKGECIADDPKSTICENGLCTCQYGYKKESNSCLRDVDAGGASIRSVEALLLTFFLFLFLKIY